MKNAAKMAVMWAATNVLALGVASAVMAEEEAFRANYAQVKAGAFQPVSDLDDAGFDTGGAFGVSYGRYLTRNLLVEATVDGFASEDDVKGVNAVADRYDQENSLSAAAFLLTLKGEIPVGRLDLFGGVGGGIYTVVLDSDIDSSRLGDFSADDSDTVFGAHAVIGANYNFTERFFMGLEGMYRWTDDVELSETVASIPVEYNGNLSGYMVTLNAGFRF